MNCSGHRDTDLTAPFATAKISNQAWQIYVFYPIPAFLPPTVPEVVLNDSEGSIHESLLSKGF